MHAQFIFLVLAIKGVWSIYPYFDTQDFIYNIPKVFRISITLDKLLEHYEKKPSKDPEWYIALGIARGIIFLVYYIFISFQFQNLRVDFFSFVLVSKIGTY